MEEIWKRIPEYESRYEASNIGRIRSLNYNKTGKICVLSPCLNGKHYFKVGLSKNNRVKYFSVHKLVWLAFNGKVPEGYEINHINEDKTDNRLENLNLLTHKENLNWGTCNERISINKKGKLNTKKSKHVLQFTLDGVLVREWPSTMECGRNGFSSSYVGACCRGEYGRTTHKGYIWKYKNAG